MKKKLLLFLMTLASLFLLIGCVNITKEKDLGTYDYVQRVYNQNLRNKKYRLPEKMKDGEQVPFDDGLIKMSLTIQNQRVKQITIKTTNPRSSEYMQTFEGFEFGFDAVSTWINNYNESTDHHTHSEGIVKGILASYDTTKDNVLTVTLTRVSGLPRE